MFLLQLLVKLTFWLSWFWHVGLMVSENFKCLSYLIFFFYVVSVYLVWIFLLVQCNNYFFVHCSEFQLIHELCLYVLSASQRTELIRATLSTLHAFLSWIPLGYIFESPLVCIFFCCCDFVLILNYHSFHILYSVCAL